MSDPSSADAREPSPQAMLFRDRNFVLLWLGQLISWLGDWALFIAIPVTVYNATNNRASLSFAVMSGAMPILLFGLVAGVLVDRWSRQRTMIVSDLCRGVVVLLLCLPDFHRLGRNGLWLCYGVNFAAATFACFFAPARAALMAAFLPRPTLMQANAVTASGKRITELVGPVLGGVLLSTLGPRGCFLFDAGTFLVSALCVSCVTSGLAPTAAKAGRGLAGIRQDLLEGLRCFWTSRVLGALAGFLTIGAVAGGITNALEYAFLRDMLHANTRQYGILMSVFGAGAFVGTLLTSLWARKFAPVGLIASGFGLAAAAVFTLAYAPNQLMGGIAFFLYGIGNILFYIPSYTLLQATSVNAMRGRIFATMMTLGSLAATASAALAAALTHVPLRPLFATVAGVLLFCAIVAGPLLSERWREATTKQTEHSPAAPLEAVGTKS